MFFYYKDCNYQIIAFTNGYSKKTGKKSRYVKCICMNLWGVAILELDSHPDHNKEEDYVPCACPKVIDPSHTT